MNQIISITLFLLMGYTLFAQEEKSNPFQQYLEVGTLAGVEISRNTGDFKFAYAIRHTGVYALSPHFSLGLGLGFEKYDDISLLPIFLDVHAFLKPRMNTSFFAFQLGYASGWHEEYKQLDDYHFEGGLFMEFDYGRRILIKDRLNFNIAIGMKFQNSEIEINNIFLEDYEEHINYLLLSFKVGIGF